MPPVVWTQNHGRDGWSSPLDIAPDRSAESRNVHFYQGGLGTKRGGATAMVESGSPSGHNALIEYIPGQDQAAAELWIVDNTTVVPPATGQIFRCTAGSATTATLTVQTLKDDISGNPANVSSAVINGKLYLAYKSGVNRLHVFDPNNATANTVRRAGVGTPAAPTGADDGAGVLSLSRSYKVAFTEQQSSVTIRRSLLSPVLTRTIVAKAGSTITKPASLSENETHWELYAASTATGTYYLIATTVVATTTFDDTSATIDTTTAEPSAGANTPWPSVRFLGTDGKRLLGFGVFESTAGDSVTPKNGRVYFGPVLDSSSVHDDERLSNTTEIQGFIDLARNTGAVDRGLTPRPVNNIFFAFQSVGTYALIPTESALAPYRRVPLDPTIGATNNQSIVMAKDKRGGACAFFLDPTLGPHIIGGSDGLKWCGKDVKDLWDTVNKDASTLAAWALWYPDRNQVWFAVPTGSSNTPDTILVLDVTELTPDDEGDLRGGWSVYTGTLAAAMCGVVFSNTCASTRSRVRVPYVGLTSGTTLLRYDESATSDNGTTFQAYVTSGVLAQDTVDIELQRAYLAATAQAGVTIQQSLVRNFGDEANRTSSVVLTAQGAETTVFRKFEDAAVQDAWALQVTLGDPSANTSAWTLYQWRSDLKTGAPK
jgi:hypothetical protein